MSLKSGFYSGYEITHHLLPCCSCLLIVIAAGFLIITVTLSQPSQETAFQNNQISNSNFFVSGSNGSIYLIFGNNLYRNSTGEADTWDQIAQNVQCIAVDPKDDNVIYAITTKTYINESLMIKSLDGGKTWISLEYPPANWKTLPNYIGKPWLLYINPENSQEIFAATETGLIKTSDGGFTWKATLFTEQVSQFMVNSRTPSYYYARVRGTIYISTDKGITWKRSETGLPTEIVRGKGRTASKLPVGCSVLVFVNWDKPFLLAGTVTGGLFRSDDDGVSWKSSGVGIAGSGKLINAFVGSKQIILATADSIYSSTNGTNWKYLPIKSGKYYPQILLGVLGYAKHDGLFLLFRFNEDSGDIFRIGYLDSKGILIGLNYGVLTHSEVDNVWVGSMKGHPTIFAATANLYSSDQIQQWTRPTFISMSQDGGYSWEIVEKADCGEQALVRSGLPTEIWMYGSAKCVRTTNDGGLNWTNVPGINFRYANGSMSRITLDPQNKNVWYYCVGVNEYHLYRYQYDPSTGQGQSVDLKVLAPDVVVAEENNKLLFTGSGQLSTDGGWTWVDKSKALSNMVQGISEGYRKPFKLVSFHNGQILAVVGKSEPTLSGIKASASIIKSSDMGSTWQKVYSFPNEQWSQEVFPNPNNPSNFFIATVSHNQVKNSWRETASKVYETQDAGETWHQIYAHDVVQNNGSQDVEKICGVSQMITEAGRVLFVGGSHGLWRSQDEGKTWKRIGGVQ